MTWLLRRALTTVRVWLGIIDPSENRLHPAHGWLLPELSAIPVLRAAPIVPPAGSRIRFEGGR
jgi:hypothetical protein